VFNTKGEFLLTQRALSKKVWPSVWTNSVCGHPAPEESDISAVMRRLEYEVGITSVKQIRCIAPNYRYKTPPYNGIIENEICPIFVALSDQEPQPNPAEVEAFNLVPWTQVASLIKEQPDTLSYWFKDQFQHVFANNPHFIDFTEN
jgi:isopentenyl-diphosphate delta-isomerase